MRLVFDDGHDTGLYTWAYLYELGKTYAAKWQHYLDRLAQLGIAYPTVIAHKKPLTARGRARTSAGGRTRSVRLPDPGRMPFP